MVVQLEGLVKRYGDAVAVDNVDIGIEAGEILGLLGPNGAGKTTSINVINGLTTFDSGTVRLFEQAPGRNDREIRRRIGVVPQEIAVFEDLTAAENVSYFARLYGVRGKHLNEAIDFALEFTGLAERRDQKPSSFSGGMKRRLNIACAIAHRPELVIMDEPTVGIDPQSRNHILESVRALNATGTTIIYTSHYMEEVEAVCTRVVVMDRGRVIASGTQNELKRLVSDDEVIDLELERMTPAAADAAQSLSGVQSCSADGTHLRVTAARSQVRLGRLVEKVTEAGSEVLSAHVERPTLEGVFLSLTGRTLRD